MSFGCPLLSLCHDHLQKGEATATFYEQAAHAVLRGDNPTKGFLSELNPSFEEHDVSPKALIDRWYAFLGSSFILVLSGQNSALLQEGILKLCRIPFWSELQLIQALKTLCSALAGLSMPKITPIQSPNGAVPFEAGQHWPWADVPFTLTQAELGLFWGIIGILETDKNLLEAAYKIAHWQLNTLDFDGKPLIGLFNTESEASMPIQLIFNYLLFRLISATEHEPKFAFWAQKQLDHLQSITTGIPLVALLLEQWIDKNAKSPKGKESLLDDTVQDSDTVLAGIRSPGRTVMCTLSGGRTGIGSIRKGDVSILTYGPQLSTIGDCSAFGIESGINRTHANLIEQEVDHFAVKRTVRLVSPKTPHLSASLYQVTPPAELWGEIIQNYADEILRIDARFVGFEKKENFNFTFFAKANECRLCHGETVRRGAPNRYEGKPQPLSLHGNEGLITIIPEKGTTSMQIIPLAGDFSFWGADYLISYEIPEPNCCCQWKISI